MRLPETVDRKPVGDGRMPVPVAISCSACLWGKLANHSETRH
jgi:hypothetical protein